MGNVEKFGPRQLRSDDDSFLLTKAEWLTIQVYATNALGLPTTEALMREKLKLKADEPIAPFQKIIDAYAAIYSHCKVWQDDAFPDSVKLAGDIYQYNQLVPTYYNAMVPYILTLEKDPTDAKAMKAVKTILTRLENEAKGHADHAQAVYSKIESFAKNTEADQITIQGSDGKSGLVAWYESEFGAKSKEATETAAMLAAARNLLQEAIDEYHQDVIVAATTPTYVFVPIWGNIIAPVIAGVYTKKALDALETQGRARAEIARLEAKEARNALLIEEIKRAQSGIKTIQQSMNAALPSIQKIRGAWAAIASDFGNLVTGLDTNIADMLEILAELAIPGIKIAIDQWDALAKRADKYRTNAYIQVTAQAA